MTLTQVKDVLIFSSEDALRSAIQKGHLPFRPRLQGDAVSVFSTTDIAGYLAQRYADVSVQGENMKEDNDD